MSSSTTIFTIQPNPHWVIIDNFSKLPDGAAIYTYRSLDPNTFKPAFQDAQGSVPYGQPITGFGNGTMPPIFWEFDPNNPTDTYYIRVYDKENIPGNGAQFLWDFDGLSGAGSGGGGGGSSAKNIQNFVVNGVFFRNIGDQAGPLPTTLTIAPSNFESYVNDPTNLNGPTGPDIIFAKGSATATDSLSFKDFTPLGINSLAPDITPIQYLEYSCGVPGSGEVHKYVQFPISQGVQNLSQQPMKVRIWARCNSGDNNISLTWRQFYGSGGAPSPDQITNIANIALTSSWDFYEFSSLVPDATTMNLGDGGNDALFLQVNLPLDTVTNIDFVKPAAYLGNLAPQVDYATNDMIDSIIDSPRTGDVRMSLNSFLFGWVAMNDGTIANAGATGTVPGQARANKDTFPLFSLIWNTFVGNQSLAPMYSTNVLVPYGASPAADFSGGRRISLTAAAARVMAAIGGSHTIGTVIGAETVALTTANLPATDGVSAITGYVAQAAPGVFGLVGGGPNTLKNIAPSGTPVDVRQPTVYMNFFIKL